MLLSQQQQAFHPTNRLTFIRAISEMLTKIEFQPSTFPDTLPKGIL
ncbi:hypothetical protein [Nostoc sp.]